MRYNICFYYVFVNNKTLQNAVNLAEIKDQFFSVSNKDQRTDGDDPRGQGASTQVIIRKIENQTGVYVSSTDVIPDLNTVAVHPSDDTEPETRQQLSYGRLY